MNLRNSSKSEKKKRKKEIEEHSSSSSLSSSFQAPFLSQGRGLISISTFHRSRIVVVFQFFPRDDELKDKQTFDPPLPAQTNEFERISWCRRERYWKEGVGERERGRGGGVGG